MSNKLTGYTIGALDEPYDSDWITVSRARMPENGIPAWTIGFTEDTESVAGSSPGVA